MIARQVKTRYDLQIHMVRQVKTGISGHLPNGWCEKCSMKTTMNTDNFTMCTYISRIVNIETTI